MTVGHDFGTAGGLAVLLQNSPTNSTSGRSRQARAEKQVAKSIAAEGNKRGKTYTRKTQGL